MFSYLNYYNMLSPGSQMSMYMDYFHNFNCAVLTGVFLFVMMLFACFMFGSMVFKDKKVDYRTVELLCSVLPCMILIALMIPSLWLLYYSSIQSNESSVSVKINGHQWYWSYSYGDINSEFDSYMKQSDSMNLSESRLLEVDNRLFIPIDANIQFCISSGDVIHSWAMPSMSIKVDAMSGILSVLYYKFTLIGVYFGQCSEICGSNHSFMPIVLEVTSPHSFMSWF